MGRPRTELQTLLEAALQTEFVYFQPSDKTQMVYPCIVYKRDAMTSNFADNNPYSRTNRYMVTVIDRIPDSPILKRIESFPLTSFVRHFAADGLNHDIYNIYH